MEQLTAQCTTHNLALNTCKTMEMVIDFRRTDHQHHLPLTINGTEVERVHSAKFLGVHLIDELTSSDSTTAVIKREKQCLHSLRKLTRVEHPTQAMTMLCIGTIESILTDCIFSWFGNTTAEGKNKQNRIVRKASAGCLH